MNQKTDKTTDLPRKTSAKNVFKIFIAMNYKLILLVSLLYFSFHQAAYSQVNLNGLKVDDHENITILIEELTVDAQDIGLTRSRLRSRTEIRFRQVGLRPNEDVGDAFHYYINVNVVGPAFNISAKFNRPLFFWGENSDGDTRLLRTAGTTYERSILGTHGGNPEYIIGALDQILDDFISKYLQVND